MSNVLWDIEYEQACEDFGAGRIDLEEFNRRLGRLGFDPGEISDHVEAVTS